MEYIENSLFAKQERYKYIKCREKTVTIRKRGRTVSV